jgi:hypothetical protein
MLARRLTAILPAMSLAEALETTCIHRVTGRTGARTALVTTRLCRAPHHMIADVGSIGGGQMMVSHTYNLPRVIAIDLAALAAIAARVVPRRAGVTHGNPPEAVLGQGVLGRQHSC